MGKRRCSLFFYGKGEKSGLPDPFHRYEIYVSKWNDGHVATVVTATGSPMPAQTSFFSNEGRKHAMMRALNSLQLLHGDLKHKFG